MAKITEGYMPYLNNKTYYRIVGEKTGKKKPLLFLHGGPGSTHNYFEVLDKVADLDGRQLIMYDQIGCGNSFIDGCPELWTKQTWVDELRALREHLELDEVHLLGQSWGGMLSIIYECDYKPEGVKSYVLSSTLPYNAIWESEQKRRVAFLPADMQEAIAEAEKTGNYSGEAYDRAIGEFMRRHCAGAFDENSPECLTRPKKSGVEPYVAGWGPNEFTPTGSLRDYDYMDKLKDFSKPCLIMNGQEDLCSPYIAKLMFDAIPNAKWELFAYSRHMCFVEETDKYIDILIKWLNEND